MALSMPTSSNFALSAPTNVDAFGERVRSELSASLVAPSPLESYKPSPNQYRNIKNRYFQSLNLASPMQAKQTTTQQQPEPIKLNLFEESTPKTKPLEPVAIKSHANNAIKTRRATTNSPTGLYGGFSPAPVIQRPTEAIAIKSKTRPSSDKAVGASVHFKLDSDTETDTDLDSSGSEYDDTFLFENTPSEHGLRRYGQYEVKHNDNLGKTYTPFVPPHLISQKSDFSLYRQDQRRTIQKKVEKFV